MPLPQIIAMAEKGYYMVYNEDGIHSYFIRNGNA